MCPDTAWRDLVEAVADGDPLRAKEIAEDLLYWLDHGGFPPTITGFKVMDTIITRATCQAI
jgi:hypothetical protein